MMGKTYYFFPTKVIELSFSFVTCMFIVLLVQVVAQNGDQNFRLPNDTYPIRYNVEITTRIHDDSIGSHRFSFEGKVTIQLKTKENRSTNSITLNYREIDIIHVRLWYQQGGWERIIINDNYSYTLDSRREFLHINSPQALEGLYYLEITYNGTLREDNAGFYRSSYTDGDGEVKWLAATQFSSTDARHAFPCYDEPGIRAPIGLRVVHGVDYSVLSNGRPIDIRNDSREGLLVTTFEDTPPMQTYILGIVVSNFQETSYNGYLRHKAFNRPKAFGKEDTKFILEAGFETLNFLEQFLEIDLILPKIYHVAIPDFAAGAMENYGLITYKEENFFYDYETSPMKQKKKIATIVGHEIGHHYFGNYVSPAWWSYLWMKEGFARFFEYYASNKVFPELEIEQTYTVDKTHNVFEMDSLIAVRPMTYYVNTQTEIANIFDDIAYDKGGAVLRMFHHAIGKEAFRRTLINFLQTNALQAVNPEQFAKTMQKVMDLLPIPHISMPTANELLKSWTEQAGYPVLHVSRTQNCSIIISQKRYLLKNNIEGPSTTWILPYNFANALEPNFDITIPAGWLSGTTKELIPDINQNWTCDDWLIFNKQQTGYYRINYDDNLWNLIVITLSKNHSTIHHLNRAQLIDDALNNARTGRLSYELALQLLRYLSKELNYVPWAAVDRNLRILSVLLNGSSSYSLWLRYCLEFLYPIYEHMGIVTHEEDSLMQRMAREIVVAWTCKVGSLRCLNDSTSIVESVVGKLTPDIDPDLRETIICNGLRSASYDAFNYFWKQMQASQNQAYRSELIRALGCTQNGEFLTKLLNTTIDENGVYYFPQERERVLLSVLSNGILGMNISTLFLERYMDQININYNKGNFGGRAISSIIKNMAKQTASENMHLRLQNLMAKLFEKGYLRNSDMLQSLEQSSENLNWIRDKGKEIERWLEQQYQPPTYQPNTVSSALTSTLFDNGSTLQANDTTLQTTLQTNAAIASSITFNNSFISTSIFTNENSITSMSTQSLAVSIAASTEIYESTEKNDSNIVYPANITLLITFLVIFHIKMLT
ncbi:aminopeptidase N-like [Anopheles darlingi]|uniref:aminopeptidase N-like n=1 Tax=Anopheles darlingi TaxID=43151 RepID=UPI00210036E7|nr:aminopeptidase N-like [Anopheles darlingi]